MRFLLSLPTCYVWKLRIPQVYYETVEQLCFYYFSFFIISSYSTRYLWKQQSRERVVLFEGLFSFLNYRWEKVLELKLRIL